MDKKGKMTGWGPIVLFVAIAVVATVFVMDGKFGDTSASVAPFVVTDGGSGTKLCTSETTPVLTITAIDTDNPGTAIADKGGIYRLTGNKGWNVYNSGDISLQSGSTYEVVPGINTTVQAGVAFGKPFPYTAKCQEVDSVELEMYNDAAASDVSSTFYDRDGTASAVENYAADDVKPVSVRFETSSDTYFGNPNIGDTPNVLCIDLHGTEWDAPTEVSYAGDKLDRASVPQVFVSANTSYETYCYKAPVIEDDMGLFKFTLDADDSIAPHTNVTVSVFAGGYFINADTGDVEFGVEDEDGNIAGAAYNATALLLVD